MRAFALMSILSSASAFVVQPRLGAGTRKLAASHFKPEPQMALPQLSLDQMSTVVAGVVAVDGGTVGLDVQFGAFLAVILGLLIPCVFLITLYIQSEAGGTWSSMRMPDYSEPGNADAYTIGAMYDDAGPMSYGTYSPERLKEQALPDTMRKGQSVATRGGKFGKRKLET